MVHKTAVQDAFRERIRHDLLLCREHGHAQKRFEWIIGVDEVGRGPLAGPVAACAVALPVNTLHRWHKTIPKAMPECFLHVNDSKKIEQ